MVKEFREFILGGNLVELAVAVVVGTAFAAVVSAFVADLVTPLIAAVGGEPDVERGTRECPACLSHVPVGVRRCAFCTQELPATG